jgi:hypothetical protein
MICPSAERNGDAYPTGRRALECFLERLPGRIAKAENAIIAFRALQPKAQGRPLVGCGYAAFRHLQNRGDVIPSTGEIENQLRSGLPFVCRIGCPVEASFGARKLGAVGKCPSLGLVSRFKILKNGPGLRGYRRTD